MARNGYLAEDGIVLVTVEDDDQLIASAAASFRNMKAAAAADGVGLWIVEPAGAYRRAWVQNDMVDNPSRYNLNPASVIGFGRSGQSHGWGNRIDVNSSALTWMLRNAARFGWTREYGARDPNHFKHDGVTAIGGGAGGFTPIERHPDMYLLRTLDGAVALVTANGMVNIASLEHLDLFSRLFKAYPAWETFNSDQRAVIAGYIQAANTADDAETAKILDALTRVKVDPAPLVAAVVAEIARQGVTVDLAPLESAVAAGFASVNANIDDQPTEFRIAPA